MYWFDDLHPLNSRDQAVWTVVTVYRRIHYSQNHLIAELMAYYELSALLMVRKASINGAYLKVCAGLGTHLNR